MFGKPIALATRADLDRLIDEDIPEGRHLEYKEAVPVSKEEIKRQAKEGKPVAVDEAIAAGKGIGDHGRNELLEELVAFANGDGGVIVLGMAETPQAPPRAAKLKPIPHVAALERRLRDAIVACVEPRMPSTAVKAIETESDGSGVILLEVQSSILGPHRVRPTRNATIRREDSCSQLSMTEIHDMVLRNARRFDETNAKLVAEEQGFWDEFTDYFRSHTSRIAAPTERDKLEIYCSENQLALFGVRITVVPHQNLGIARLESFAGLCARRKLSVTGETELIRLLEPDSLSSRRFINGVRCQSSTDPRFIVTAERGGLCRILAFETTFVGAMPTDYLMSLSGTALSLYEGLRQRAGMPSMTAEVSVGIIAIGSLKPSIGHGINDYGSCPLEMQTDFPRYTIGTRESFDVALSMIAGDFANAGDLRVRGVPKFGLVDS